jgi:hypothetical protein
MNLNKKKAFVITHLGLGDHLTAIGLVRYLTTNYDEVVVVCRKKNKTNVELFYIDNKNIKVMDVESDSNISPNFGFNLKKFQKITNGYDLYLTGMHNLKRKYNQSISIPYCFYESVKINPQYFWKYFYIKTTDKAKNLYDELKFKSYIFIHNICSSGTMFDENDILIKFKHLNKKNILFINPCKNFYKENDYFYNLANKFIGHPLIHYKKIIENAKYNFLCDSSFLCMALNLEIKEDNNFIFKTRTKYNFYLYMFENKNKKIFKSF